jgi:hypothetical protein
VAYPETEHAICAAPLDENVDHAVGFEIVCVLFLRVLHDGSQHVLALYRDFVDPVCKNKITNMFHQLCFAVNMLFALTDSAKEHDLSP